MKYESYSEIELYLWDIGEIINQLLWYLYDPETINDVSELYYAVQSIPDRIKAIETILEEEFRRGDEEK